MNSMMKWLVFCGFIYSESLLAQAISDKDWAVYHQSDIGTFWFKDTEDGLGVYLSQVKVTASLAHLVEAIDPSNQKLWRKTMGSSEILQDYPNQEKLFRVVFELPWPIQQRDIVALMRVVQTFDAPSIQITFEDRSQIDPENPERIRISDFEAQWWLIPCPKEQVVLVHQMRMNPEGAIPLKLFHWLLRRNQPNNFMQLQTWLSEPKEQRNLARVRAPDKSFKNWSPWCKTWLQDPIGGL